MARSVFRYVYKTTCIITGRFYIGKHTSHTIDNEYLGSGKLLKYSVAKYGTDNHVKEILKFANSLEELNLLEEQIIDEFLNTDLCMNLKPGGSGGWDNVSRIAKANGTLYTDGMKGKKHSAESKLKMSVAGSGENNSNFGKKAFKNPVTGERLMLLECPAGWITAKEFAKSKLTKNSSFGRKWFNDGNTNFFLSLSDDRTHALNVGRLNTNFKKVIKC